jgi:hypothetical protein
MGGPDSAIGTEGNTEQSDAEGEGDNVLSAVDSGDVCQEDDVAEAGTDISSSGEVQGTQRQDSTDNNNTDDNSNTPLDLVVDQSCEDNTGPGPVGPQSGGGTEDGSADSESSDAPRVDHVSGGASDAQSLLPAGGNRDDAEDEQLDSTVTGEQFETTPPVDI